jgi:UDP-4-amino-4-deoxy-L-arabinose formyltransferase/UDP-glucuronic acid dehydrogenase (UDP-4-keto-hexauronic acid decarboxylating)
VEDGVECLIKIIENRDGLAEGQIFNIGSPDNECSMRELAEKLTAMFVRHPERRGADASPEIIEVSSKDFYGEDYQDILRRKPSIEKARQLLGWEPRTGLDEALSISLDYFLKEAAAAR